MKTILIKKHKTTGGCWWSIENWPDYVVYLQANHLTVPTGRYGIFVSDETASDADTDFEGQIPLLFHLKGDKIKHSFSE